jgi:hypothetical protein
LLLRQAWILDDAFIYYRYADNLLFLGRGLVFNAGEWVEGYSSPLWMLLLTLLRALRLDWWLLIRLCAVTAWIVAWAGMVRLRWLCAPRGARVWNLPLLYLAASYPVLSYWTSGLETPLVQLAAIASMLLILEPQRRRWQILSGFMPLIRHELILPWLVLFAWTHNRTRRLPAWMLGSGATLLLAWLLARVLLYADLFPNTFYLKDGSEWEQGWRYLLQFARAQGLLWIATGAGVALSWAKSKRLDEPHLAARAIALLCATSVVVYVVRIGGDMMYYRFFAYSFPLFVVSLSGLFPTVAETLPARLRPVAMPALALITVTASVLAVPPQLDRNPHLGLANLTYEQPVVIEGINDANSHRRHEDLRFSPWTLAPVLEQRGDYALYRSTHPDGRHERVEVRGWCYDAYREFDTQVVHRWGLTDPMLARLRLPWLRPGHRRGLVVYAERLLVLRREVRAGKRPAGMRNMLRAGHRIPTWARENLERMDILEARMANRHRLGENLALALRFVPGYAPRR